MCFDGVKRLCHIRGKLRKKVRINETVSFGEEGIDNDIEFDDVESSDEENDLGVDGIDNILSKTRCPS